MTCIKSHVVQFELRVIGTECSFLAKMNCGNSEQVAGKEAVSSHITLSVWSVILAIMIIIGDSSI